MAFKFSKRSKRILETTDPRIQELFNLVLSRSPIDFGIANLGGYRTPEEQYSLYSSTPQKSKCDGYDKKSYHQTGRALDIYAYLNGGASWDRVHLAIIAGIAYSCAEELGLKLKWGGEFGSNEFKGWDSCHFEIHD